MLILAAHILITYHDVTVIIPCFTKEYEQVFFFFKFLQSRSVNPINKTRMLPVDKINVKDGKNFVQRTEIHFSNFWSKKNARNKVA